MKKGFTLIELLAVIVILAIIALIATPIILGIINDAKKESQERSIELYASAAKNAIAKHQLNNTTSPTSFDELDIEYDGDVVCTTKELYSDGSIYLADCTVNGTVVDYTYGEKQVAKGTIGICNPLNVQTEGTYTAGDKYECDVDPEKQGYDQIFYVLTNATSGSVNLIMDSNITRTGEAIKDANPTDKGLVEWISQTDYEREDIGGTEWNYWTDNNTFGPITAIEYLQEATAGWTNANPQTISTFTDNKGDPHNMAKTYTVNARMAYYSEISNVSNTTLYLINYLHGRYDEEIPVTGRNGVHGVYGYWTLSTGASNPVGAWFVDYFGNANLDYYGSNNYGCIGVRPVINLSI